MSMQPDGGTQHTCEESSDDTYLGGVVNTLEDRVLCRGPEWADRNPAQKRQMQSPAPGVE